MKKTVSLFLLVAVVLLAFVACDSSVKVSGPKMIAAIGDVQYATLQEAVDNATTETTIKLLCDAEGIGAVVTNTDCNLTFDFDGHTYTLSESKGAKLAGIPDKGFCFGNGTKVTLKNGTIKAEEGFEEALISTEGTLTIAEDTKVVPVVGKTTIDVLGGSVEIKTTDTDGIVVFVQSGVESVKFDTTPTNVTYLGKVEDVIVYGETTATDVFAATAMIGNTGYETLKNAVNAAKSGDTIILVADVEEPTTKTTLTFAEGVTLDLNEHTITTHQWREGKMYEFSGSQFTVKNGTMKGLVSELNESLGYCYAMYLNNAGTVNLENIDFVDGGIYVCDTKDAVIKDCTVDMADNSKYYAIAVDGDTTSTNAKVMNGTFEHGADGNVAWIKKGTLTIENGSFTGNFLVANNGKVEVKGGSFTDLASAVKYAAEGTTIKLLADVEVPTTTTVLHFAENVTLDLNGKTIKNGDWYEHKDYAFTGKKFTVKNGTMEGIQSSTSGREGYCYAMYTDAISSTESSGTVTLTNLTFKNGGLYIDDTENAVVENCTTTNLTGKYYGIVVSSEISGKPSKATVKSGTFTAGTNGNVAWIDGDDVNTLEIEGGDFTGNFYFTATKGVLVVKGGTFTTDPTTYLAEGYKAEPSDNKYIVSLVSE